jgi:hypothetical protein
MGFGFARHTSLAGPAGWPLLLIWTWSSNKPSDAWRRKGPDPSMCWSHGGISYYYRQAEACCMQAGSSRLTGDRTGSSTAAGRPPLGLASVERSSASRAPAPRSRVTASPSLTPRRGRAACTMRVARPLGGVHGTAAAQIEPYIWYSSTYYDPFAWSLLHFPWLACRVPALQANAG